MSIRPHSEYAVTKASEAHHDPGAITLDRGGSLLNFWFPVNIHLGHSPKIRIQPAFREWATRTRYTLGEPGPFPECLHEIIHLFFGSTGAEEVDKRRGGS